MGLMAYCSTLMGQLLQLIPRHVFDHLVDTHAWQGPDARKFTYWSHLGAMLFGPLPSPPKGGRGKNMAYQQHTNLWTIASLKGKRGLKPPRHMTATGRPITWNEQRPAGHARPTMQKPMQKNCFTLPKS
ncbi:MAG: DUF4372 domain-containing protein [Deltaproteobacteria bacterium]|nr:DUF4372 domain-containing protein [Deltaproteobacteria bacterium]